MPIYTAYCLPSELHPPPAPLKIPRNNVRGGGGGGGDGFSHMGMCSTVVTKIIFVAFSSLMLHQLEGIKQIL